MSDKQKDQIKKENEALLAFRTNVKAAAGATVKPLYGVQPLYGIRPVALYGIAAPQG